MSINECNSILSEIIRNFDAQTSTKRSKQNLKRELEILLSIIEKTCVTHTSQPNDDDSIDRQKNNIISKIQNLKLKSDMNLSMYKEIKALIENTDFIRRLLNIKTLSRFCHRKRKDDAADDDDEAAAAGADCRKQTSDDRTRAKCSNDERSVAEPKKKKNAESDAKPAIQNVNISVSIQAKKGAPAASDAGAVSAASTSTQKAGPAAGPPPQRATTSRTTSSSSATTARSAHGGGGGQRSPTNSVQRTNACKPALHPLQGSQIQRFQHLREIIEKAIRNRKTFMVYNFAIVRRLLHERGWIEKLVVHSQSSEVVQHADKMQIRELLLLIDDKKYGVVYHRVLKSKLLGSNPVDFVWNPQNNAIEMLKTTAKPVYINHFRKRGFSDFCSKIGLHRNLANLQWYHREQYADVHYPRTFVLADDMNEFVKEFRITACTNLLRWFVAQANNNETLLSPKGTIPVDAFFFAVLEAMDYVKLREDVDYVKPSYPLEVWNDFIDHYHYFVFAGEHFYKLTADNVREMAKQAKDVIGRVKAHRPIVEWEGVLNVWILKPNMYSQGNGIHITRKMCQIKEIVKQNSHLRYVIQKYIERPLLIYNTKFDIRQWFLISSANPFTVWVYRTCYLRFSSQQFSLKRFHESVHLTNNSVQCRYKNCERDSALPKENMWNLEAFQEYLKKIGFADAWQKTIFPKIRQSILAVMLSAKEDMDTRKNTFELYGADFMLTPDFQPWLIEINSNPALSASTSVTAKLCPKVIEDVIRVVLDHAENSLASTGNFELLYKETPYNLPKMPIEGLSLYGTPLPPSYFNN